MNNIYAIILAGGLGKRINSSIPKQFLELNHKPVIIHTLEKFDLPEMTGIIVVVPDEFQELAAKLIKDFSIGKTVKIIKGGDTRQGSSYNAVKCLNYNENDILIFHDAGRPFIDKKIIGACIKEAGLHGAAGVYVKATDTIAQAENEFIKQIPDRENLYYTQTPQAFRYGIIRKAHDLALSNGLNNSTDDARLVLDTGHKVKIVGGSYANIKITNAFDLELAEFMAGKEKK